MRIFTKLMGDYSRITRFLKVLAFFGILASAARYYRGCNKAPAQLSSAKGSEASGPESLRRRHWNGTTTTDLYDNSIGHYYPIALPEPDNRTSSTAINNSAGDTARRLGNNSRREERLLRDESQTYLRSRWYGVSFAPGIELAAPEVVGIDIRLFYIEDFSGQVGAAYFYKEKEVHPSAGIAYNLRRISYLKNTDLFVSYTQKTVIGGIRIELGD